MTLFSNSLITCGWLTQSALSKRTGLGDMSDKALLVLTLFFAGKLAGSLALTVYLLTH